MMLNEKSFQAEKKINYIFQKADWDCPYLAIIFSGFNTITLKEQHPYNYLRAMDGFNIHKLFIQDTCGPRGCYYLCENMDFGVERTVKALIDFIMEKVDVKRENVITLGSSKGGTASLYYGLKYKFGHVIAGVPQIKIILYLQKLIPKAGGGLVTDYMLGSNKSEENIKFINDILLKHIQKDSKTQLYLLLSENDISWETDHIPLMKKLEQTNMSYEIINETRMINHGDIAHFFPDYLKHRLLKIITGKMVQFPVVTDDESGVVLVHHSLENNSWNYKIDCTSDQFSVNKSLEEDRYDFSQLTNTAAEFKLTANFLITTEEKQSKTIYQEEIYNNILPQKLIKIEGYQFYFKDCKLWFCLKVNSPLELQYAFYLYEGNERREVIWYSQKNECTFSVEKNKAYRITYFIKMPNGEMFIKNSEKMMDIE